MNPAFFSGLRPSNRIADAGVILLHRPVQFLLHCRTWAAIPHIPSVDLPSPNYSGMQRPLRASCRPFRHRLVSVRRWTLHMRRIQKVPSVGHMNERAGSILKLQRRPLWMCGRRGVLVAGLNRKEMRTTFGAVRPDREGRAGDRRQWLYLAR